MCPGLPNIPKNAQSNNTSNTWHIMRVHHHIWISIHCPLDVLIFFDAVILGSTVSFNAAFLTSYEELLKLFGVKCPHKNKSRDVRTRNLGVHTMHPRKPIKYPENR